MSANGESNLTPGIYDFRTDENLTQEYASTNENYEIDVASLTKLPVRIGCGHYGEVWLGCLLSRKGGVKEAVAIKMPKWTGSAAEQHVERECLRAELRIMTSIGRHPNMLQLKGATTLNSNRFWLVLEYCVFGSLDKLLPEKRLKKLYVDEIIDRLNDKGEIADRTAYKREKEPKWVDNFSTRREKEELITTSDLLDFALQIAIGMEFLQNKKIVHRDLALRNLLLDAHFVVKIADFGLSRVTTDSGYYSRIHLQQPVPQHWTAPEALSGPKIRLESDLWTFGVVLWEMFELGERPYAKTELYNQALIDFYNSGHRLAAPKYAPPEIYQLMLSLWNMEPMERPSLTKCQETISAQLENSCSLLLKNTTNYIKTFGIDDGTEGASECNLNIARGYAAQNITIFGFPIKKRNSAATDASKWTKYVKPSRRCCAWLVCSVLSASTFTAILTTFLVLKIVHSPTSEKYPFMPKDRFTRKTASAEYVFVPQKKRWMEAEGTCTAWGGHLVSILSHDENELINSLREEKGEYLWIGYHTVSQTCNNSLWLWSDDQMSNFTYWDASIQAIPDGAAVCAVQRAIGTWSQQKCYMINKFVCKRELRV